MSGLAQDGAGAAAPHVRMHATCVAVGRHAALLRGPPGAGKSDLALRLIAGPAPRGEPEAFLVADDQVALSREGYRLVARAPENIAGLIEIRGVGIRRMPSVSAAPVALIVDLVAREDLVRLPPDPPPTEEVLGIALPTARLAPFEASAPLKLRLLMGAWRTDTA